MINATWRFRLRIFVKYLKQQLNRASGRLFCAKDSIVIVGNCEIHGSIFVSMSGIDVHNSTKI